MQNDLKNPTKPVIFLPLSPFYRVERIGCFTKMNAPLTTTSMSRVVSRSSLFLFLIAWFALSPITQAQLSPPPDGGYPNNTTAEGTDALASLTTGPDNTAIGFEALFSNTTADSNTAVGSQALMSDTTGNRNTATGYAALESDTTGERNTATGRAALVNNTIGNNNTGTGHDALFSNISGLRNTATGSFALFANSTASFNSAHGYFALFANTTGQNNTADGYDALLNNTSGTGNVALGFSAGANLTTGDNNIDIGNQGVAGESSTIRIGTPDTQTNAYLAGVYQTNIAKGLVVKVDSDGHLGTVGSSRRFKDAIKPMDKVSEAILSLRPVTFHYKKELDPEETPQFGLVAEDVEKINPDLVDRDGKGQIYTVRYDAINAMLLNEFLKQHRVVQELKSTVAKQAAIIAEQQKGIETVTARLEKQASQLQKVSARLATSRPAPQTVSNP